MHDDATGAGLALQGRKSSVGISRGEVSGEPYSPTIRTSGSRSTGVDTPKVHKGGDLSTHAPLVAPGLRQICRAYYDKCIASLDAASAEFDDFFVRNNAIEEFRDTLTQLWRIRRQRESQFAEIINVLQGLLNGKESESFTVDDLHCLTDAVQALSREPVLDDEAANAVTRILLKGGFDVFGPIA